MSDETGLIASAQDPIRRSSLAHDLAAIASRLQEWNVGQIVVGLPLNMNATVGPQAQKTLQFAERLGQVVSVPIATWDERLTTQQAERLLIERDVRREHRKAVIDGVAASLILQGYLDHQRLVERGDSDG